MVQPVGGSRWVLEAAMQGELPSCASSVSVPTPSSTTFFPFLRLLCPRPSAFLFISLLSLSLSLGLTLSPHFSHSFCTSLFISLFLRQCLCSTIAKLPSCLYLLSFSFWNLGPQHPSSPPESGVQIHGKPRDEPFLGGTVGEDTRMRNSFGSPYN